MQQARLCSPLGCDWLPLARCTHQLDKLRLGHVRRLPSAQRSRQLLMEPSVVAGGGTALDAAWGRNQTQTAATATEAAAAEMCSG